METEWDDRKGRPYAGIPSLAAVVVEEKNLRFRLISSFLCAIINKSANKEENGISR